MLDLDAIDRWARIDSPFHRASPLSKIFGASLGILGAAIASSPPFLLLLAAEWLFLLAWSRLPLRSILTLSGYAALFAGFYSLIDWGGGPLAIALILKAVVSALSVLSVVATTPYPRVFQAIRPILPPPLPDALLLTYRSLFILLHRWGHIYTALRLRGGIVPRHPLLTLRNISPSLGMLLLSAMDHSQGLYEAMLLRGYRGFLAG
ncbi:MAG TPA: energy-coupling factor transporter transmembrane component T, partial [Chroococcales cyanobacterium]